MVTTKLVTQIYASSIKQLKAHLKSRVALKAGAEGGDLALPLVLNSLEQTPVFETTTTSNIYRTAANVTGDANHIPHLPTALQLHLITHLHLPKAVVRHVQDLQRLVHREHVSEGLGSSSPDGVVRNFELRTW